MTKNYSGGGSCIGKPINYDAEFEKQMNALRYKEDGTAKSVKEIRSEMDKLRTKLGFPTKSVIAESPRRSPRRSSRRSTQKNLRRSERIKDKTLRRSERIREKNNRKSRVTMGGKKRTSKRLRNKSRARK
jgi:hypothetical protein